MPCTWSPRLTQGGGRLRHLVISRTHTGGIMDHDGMIQNNSHKLCIIWDAVRAANVSRKVNRLFLSTKWMFQTRSIHFSWHIIEVAAGANFCRTCRKEHFQLQENNLQRLGRLADLYVARLIASPCPFSPPTFAPSFYRFLYTDSYIHILIYRFLLLADSYSIFMPSPWAISAISERFTLHIGSLMLSLPGSAQRNICRLMKGPSLPELGKPRELAATSWDSREGCETMQSSAFTAFTLGSLLSMFHPTSSGWNWRTLFELQGVHNRNFPAAGGNTNNSSCKDSWRTHEKQMSLPEKRCAKPACSLYHWPTMWSTAVWSHFSSFLISFKGGWAAAIAVSKINTGRRGPHGIVARRPSGHHDPLFWIRSTE